MASMILLAGFAAFVTIVVYYIISLSVRGIDMFATPPINVYAFIAAKACAFGSCLFIPLGILYPSLRPGGDAGPWTWAALALFVPGAAIAVAAMKSLGDDLIFGLPGTGIGRLQTGGIFSFSRNPLYLGFIMIIVSSLTAVPHPLNIALGTAAVALHHLIVIREERYLTASRGDEYRAYIRKTGRYLPGF